MHTIRRLTVAAAASALAVGGLMMATPAQAATFGPASLTCPASAIMWGHGTKGGTGSITVRAGYYSFTDASTNTGKTYDVTSLTYAATWGASGDGATAGWGGCGS